MADFSAGHAAQRVSDAIGRPIDVLVFNSEPPPDSSVLDRYAAEHKMPLPLGDVPRDCEVISGSFWRRPIARHARGRLRSAVWTALAKRLL
jgi:hypothetical protein